MNYWLRILGVFWFVIPDLGLQANTVGEQVRESEADSVYELDERGYPMYPSCTSFDDATPLMVGKGEFSERGEYIEGSGISLPDFLLLLKDHHDKLFFITKGDSWSALTYATYWGRLDIVSALLDAGLRVTHSSDPGGDITIGKATTDNIRELLQGHIDDEKLQNERESTP